MVLTGESQEGEPCSGYFTYSSDLLGLRAGQSAWHRFEGSNGTWVSLTMRSAIVRFVEGGGDELCGEVQHAGKPFRIARLLGD